MYKLFLVLLAAFLIGDQMDAQQMQWVPGHQVDDPNYTDGSNCKENVLCYTLAYTPAQTGVLTSYTTNFLVDCDGGNSAVVSNSSLVMTNNSNQESACAEIGMLLMNSSGNSGQITVKAGRTIYLHEICLQTSSKSTELQFVADKVGGMTTSLDVRDQPAVTERPDFQPFLFKSNQTACEETSANVFVNVDTDTPTDLTGERDGIELSLFPNPTSSQLQIRFEHSAEMADFRLLNASGKEVRVWKATTGLRHTINVSNLPGGMYYLNARTAQEELTEKFVVRK